MNLLDRLLNNRRVLLILSILILFFCAVSFLVTQMDHWIMGEETEAVSQKKITINGVSYRERYQTVYLIAGLDEYGEVGGDSYNNTQQADFVSLVAFNHITKQYSILMLNRDTMVEYNQYGVNGEPTGSLLYGQLALSHTQGNGGSDSCLNIKKAVERLLPYVSVDYYVVMTMDVVESLTDFMGGVALTMPADYTNLDESFVSGAEVLLTGEQAIRFVGARMSVDDGTNVSRMNRQRLFMEAFCEALKQSEITESAWEEEFTALATESHICTDYNVQSFQKIIEDFETYDSVGIYTPEGTIDTSTGYTQFFADADSLNDLMVMLYLEQE